MATLAEAQRVETEPLNVKRGEVEPQAQEEDIEKHRVTVYQVFKDLNLSVLDGTTILQVKQMVCDPRTRDHQCGLAVKFRGNLEVDRIASTLTCPASTRRSSRTT